jgi:hypothetical protein
MDIEELNSWWGDDETFSNLDWDEVVDVDMGVSYSWSEFHAWYNPADERYYWGSASGCSCDSFRSYFRSISDLENGPDRASVMKALSTWMDGMYEKNPSLLVAKLHEINSYQPPPIREPRSTTVIQLKDIEQ